MTLHNIDTNTDVITVKTDSNGVYTVTELPQRRYTVTVAANGFKKVVENDVILNASEHRTLNVTLAIGQVTEQVVVTAADDTGRNIVRCPAHYDHWYANPRMAASRELLAIRLRPRT